MKVLVACEFSGVVRDAFAALGHEAWSCDLEPSSGKHIQGDVLEVLKDGWDLMVAHPPCTFLNSAGLHWVTRGRIEKDGRPRAEHQAEGLEFVAKILNAPINKIAMENPVGCIPRRIHKDQSGAWVVGDRSEAITCPYTQKIQPYQFGDDASKGTCLWLKGLRPLTVHPEWRKEGRWVNYNGKLVERWANQTDSGQNILGPSEDRGKLRAVTYPGIAREMAKQWS